MKWMGLNKGLADEFGSNIIIIYYILHIYLYTDVFEWKKKTSTVNLILKSNMEFLQLMVITSLVLDVLPQTLEVKAHLIPMPNLLET